jgi:hypothetical protein
MKREIIIDICESVFDALEKGWDNFCTYGKVDKTYFKVFNFFTSEKTSCGIYIFYINNRIKRKIIKLIKKYNITAKELQQNREKRFVTYFIKTIDN